MVGALDLSPRRHVPFSPSGSDPERTVKVGKVLHRGGANVNPPASARGAVQFPLTTGHHACAGRGEENHIVNEWGDRFGGWFEICSWGQVVRRTMVLTALITGAAVAISDLWLRTGYPQLYPVIGLGNIVSTIAIGIILAGPMLFGFNMMSWRLWRANQRLQQLASRDPLTGLLNRRAWVEEHAMMARKARRKGETGYLMVIDADHFKQINDTHGHDVGDKVLQHLASVIAASNNADAICARLGGEEFAIAGFTILDGRLEAEHVRTSVTARPFTADGVQIPLTVSIGLTLLDADTALSDAMRRADNALYAAKNGGRNRVCVAPGRLHIVEPDALQGESQRVMKRASSN
jgi:diguanylate cyclase (GGDEF)-like protein